MQPRLLWLHPKTYSRLVHLRKQAERDGAYRVAKRLQAVVLNSKGRTSGELAGILEAPVPGCPSGCGATKPTVWRAYSKGIVPGDREI
jgi:hypothetical protein